MLAAHGAAVKGLEARLRHRLKTAAVDTWLGVAACLLLCAWLSWLGHGSWLLSNATPTSEANHQASARPVATAPLNNSAIARLFGAVPAADTLNTPRVPLDLLGSLLESNPQLSRALIGSPQGSRFYQIGQPLPGGGSLRRIDATQVLILRNGVEQTLTLATAKTSLLTPSPPAGTTVAAAPAGSLIQPSL
nr:type II secretion system protein N [Pseudomonas gregormendelii]